MSASPIRLVKRYLCVKKLTVNDGFTNKSVKLPRAEARFFMGELRNRQTIPLVLLDEGGNCWELMCTCNGAQYALSCIGAFCEAHGARPGCYFIFYADHEHIVRLAVRQHLPDDVQAALAAARAAAMAVRSPTNPRAPSQALQQQVQQQPDAAGSNSFAASLPADTPSTQPVLFDDPVALDEMPLGAATCDTMAEDLHSVTTAVPAASTAANKALLGSEVPSKSMPLQDRSNIPPGQPLANVPGNAGTKSKSAGGRHGHNSSVTGTSVNGVSIRSSISDKENDPDAYEDGPAENPQPAGVCAFPAVSTGALQAPSPPSTNRAPLQQQRQPLPAPWPVLPPPPAPPPAPSPPSALLFRSSPPTAPSPPPATRLRLRFEARVRAQAGKLHPLSVRTGPESPLPSPLGYSCAANSWPMGSLTALYPPHGAAALMGGRGGHHSNSHSLLPFPYSATGTWMGHPAYGGFHHDSLAAVEAYHYQESVGPYPSVVDYRLIAPNCHHPAFGNAFPLSPGRQLERAAIAAGASLPPKEQHLQPCDGDWTQDLRCDELLDWEVGGRRSTGRAKVGVCNTFAAVPAMQQHGCPQYPMPTQPPALPPPPPRPSCDAEHVASGPFTLPKLMNMGLLRQLLLLQGSQAQNLQLARPDTILPYSRQGSPHTSAIDQDPQQRQSGTGAISGGPLSQQHPISHQSPLAPRHLGALFPFASSNSALQQLLSMSAAWDLAALSGLAGGRHSDQSSMLGASAPYYPHNSTTRPSPPAVPSPRTGAVPKPSSQARHHNHHHQQNQDQQQRAGLIGEGSPPCARSLMQPSYTWEREEEACTGVDSCMDVDSCSGAAEERNIAGNGGPCGARPKSRLSIGREMEDRTACGLPVQSPSCKRQRSVVPRQMMARKVLTAQDLLTDRVVLSMAPAVCSILVSRLRGEGGNQEVQEHKGKVTRGAEHQEGDSGGTPFINATTIGLTATSTTATNRRQHCQGLELLSSCSSMLLSVDVLVESGAHYEGVLVLRGLSSSSGGSSAPAREWELQGLRPYLIRRQAGVGDVLTLAIDDATDQQVASSSCLPLVAQLQQYKVI